MVLFIRPYKINLQKKHKQAINHRYYKLLSKGNYYENIYDI